MSKLSLIQQSLKKNPDIVIVETKEVNNLFAKNGYWSHLVDFYIAPANGRRYGSGLYTPDELQLVMLSLVPGIPFTSRDDFFYLGKNDLEFGFLCFDEPIGTESFHHEIVLTAENAHLLPPESSGNKYVVDRPAILWRRIFVRLFPNKRIALNVLHSGGSRDRISKDDLDKYF